MLMNSPITSLDRLLLQMPPVSGLRVSVRNLGNICLLQCAGRITPGDDELLRHWILRMPIEREIVLDLAQIETVDTSGIGVLVALRGWAITAGTGFKLMNLRPAVERLLRATNLLGTFHLCTLRETLAIWCRAARCRNSV